MAGMFDDLMPQQGAAPAPTPSGGMFDDLLPAKTDQPPATSSDVPVPGILERFFTNLPKFPGAVASSIANTASLPHDVMTGERIVPQSANMPGGENTKEIGAAANLATMVLPLSPAGTMTKASAPTATMLKNAAEGSYDAANKIGIELKPEALDKFGIGLKAQLNERGFDAELTPKSFAVLNKLSNYPEGSTVTAQNLRTIQKSLGNVKNMSADPAERMVAGQSLGEFNNLLENLHQVPSALAKGTPESAAQFSQLVKDANGNYAAYKQSQGFDFRGDKAEYAANAAHSGMNLENNLRSQVKQMLSNPKQLRGLDDTTIAALKDFNTGSRTANTLRTVGNIFGGGGGLGMLASGAASHMLGLPFEVGPGVGLGLKSIGNQMSARQFSNIGDIMRANSPLGRSGVTSQTPISPLFKRLPFLGLGSQSQ